MLFYLYSKKDIRYLFEDFQNGATDAENITIGAQTLVVADEYHVIKLTKICLAVLKELSQDLRFGNSDKEYMLAFEAMAKHVYLGGCCAAFTDLLVSQRPFSRILLPAALVFSLLQYQSFRTAIYQPDLLPQARPILSSP